jgi:triosephosphate isomerase
MNMTVEEARNFVADLGRPLADIAGVEKVLCPPFTALTAVHAMLEGLEIGLGAQDMHWEARGAFTGAVSPAMVRELCAYVIIGHSERRTYFGEKDEAVNKKVRAAHQHGLIPIVCVGETLEQYDSGVTGEVVGRQVRVGLAGTDPGPARELIVAYEPVWAIGTGRTATPAQAGEAHAHIRSRLKQWFGGDAADQCVILYGGSVKPDNIRELMAQPDVDGALVGGASLDVRAFHDIIVRSRPGTV